MNLHKSLHEYVSRAISLVPGSKSLLIDSETSRIISLFTSYTDLIAEPHQCYLTENIDVIAQRTDLHKQEHHDLKAIAFIQPTFVSLNSLKTLLTTPRYLEYHIFYTNLVPPNYLEAVAEADIYDRVKQVHEYYFDYYAMSPTLFHFNNSCRNVGERSGNLFRDEKAAMLERDVNGLVSLCLSLKKRPEIRYAAGNENTQKVARELHRIMQRENELFTFSGEPALLLILDRKDDPVTPLLTQWTYASQIHELIGINNQRVRFMVREGSMQEMKEFVLNSSEDEFYRSNAFVDYATLGKRIEKLVSDYKLTASQHKARLDTVEDMQNFLDAFPQFRQLGNLATKHLTIFSEINRQVKDRGLLDVGELEQAVVCGPLHEHPLVCEQMVKLLADETVQWEDKLRVVMLYALRHEQHADNHIEAYRQSLLKQTLDDRQRERLKTLSKIIEIAGAKSRSQELFHTGLVKDVLQLVRDIKGINNKYIQHKPLAAEQFVRCLSGELSPREFPFYGVSQSDASLMAKGKYKNIILFVVGGITYEEHTSIENFLASDKKFNRSEYRVVMGGSYLTNSKLWMQDLVPVQEELLTEEELSGGREGKTADSNFGAGSSSSAAFSAIPPSTRGRTGRGRGGRAVGNRPAPAPSGNRPAPANYDENEML